MGRSLIYVIFAICILMAGLLLAICLAEPVANAGGIPHPDFSGMQSGGDGAARLAHIGYLAFSLQCLLLLLIVCLAALGVAEKRRNAEFMAYMCGTLLLSLLAWWQMYSGHQQFLETGVTEYFMGFPTPTSWQVYGTWFGAIPLIVLYSLGFRKFIYTEEDEAEFQQLLSEKNQNTEQ